MADSCFPVSCTLDCGGGCPLVATVSDGVVTSIRDNPARPAHMWGCVKGYQMHRVLYSDQRLRRPLIRAGPRGSGLFREVPWGEALDYMAGRLREIRGEYGAGSVLHLGGSGSTRGSLHNTGRLTKRFLAMYGGYTERHSSYSVGAALFVTPYVLGGFNVGMDAATLDKSELILLWGANPSDLKMECGLEHRIREARGRGVEVVALDPRRSLTVKSLASEWVPIYPGTDAVMMAAMLYVLIVRGLVDEGFLGRYSVGWGEVRGSVLGLDGSGAKTPEWAEAICGVPADRIWELAVKYGSTHPAALIPGASIQRTLGGEEAMRMGVVLQAATGNLGVVGGSPGCLAFGTLLRPRVGELPVPVNPEGASIQVYKWADAVLMGRAGGYPTDIKALYNVGGNYIVQGSDTGRSVEAFMSTLFNVCHDRFLTPTARLCDVVLPSTTFLERSDVVVPGSGNYLLYSCKVCEPVGESRSDFEIFCGLAERLGFLEEYSCGLDEEGWLRRFVSESRIGDYEEFRRVGLWFDEDQRRVALSPFVRDPGGNPLATPSGKIQLTSEEYRRVGGAEVPTPFVPVSEEGYPLRLVSPKSRFRVHSQNGNIEWFAARERQGLWVNPRDAEVCGVVDGEVVLVESAVGRLRAPAVVTGDIMPGVVCLLEGVWPRLGSDGVDCGGAVNYLTSTRPTMPSVASRTHSTNVRITRV